eukprot:TRINITY_DN2901_c0_g1_i2.p1 TRINITY_DN2901_c0_g1~~TRINITY_DN2901_c0_g1_i2.p1  ORF type:complete len:539 (+),score=130.70 TRINITY_DN2901_c0_g1_i2:33-1619(+)
MTEPSEHPTSSRMHKAEKKKRKAEKNTRKLVKKFGVPPTEILIDDWSAFLIKSVQWAGRLYLSSNYLCFESVIFGRKTREIIALAEIAEVSKEKHMALFRRMDVVTTDNRTVKFNNINNVGEVIEEIEKQRAIAASSGPAGLLSPNRTLITFLKEDEDDDDDEEDDDEDDDDTSTSMDSVEDEEDVQQDVKEMRMEFYTRKSLSAFGPMLGKQKFETVLDETIPVSPEDFFLLFFSDSSTFLSRYHSERGDTDINIGVWHEVPDMGYMREMSYSAKTNAPIGPPRSMVNETARYSLTTATRHLVIETQTVLLDIPYGDYFRVEARWSVTDNNNNTNTADTASASSTDNDLPSSSHVVLTLGVNFLKSTMFKGKIQVNTMQQTSESYRKWLGMAKEELKNPDVEAKLKRRSLKSSTSSSRSSTPRTISSETIVVAGAGVGGVGGVEEHPTTTATGLRHRTAKPPSTPPPSSSSSSSPSPASSSIQSTSSSPSASKQIDDASSSLLLQRNIFLFTTLFFALLSLYLYVRR